VDTTAMQWIYDDAAARGCAPSRLRSTNDSSRANTTPPGAATRCALAPELAVSPHHLSRTFRSITGQTISHHRVRLRARAALERLAGGERDLAWLAADLGFADQSHLCRVLRNETGRAPSALRRMLGEAA
jgi:AraC-like DNA-binding protein